MAKMEVDTDAINTLKESTSKRLRSLPKTYHTYTILFKKQVIEEVNLNL